MLNRRVIGWAFLPAALITIACNRQKTVDDATLRAADQDTANWLMYGRTYDDHRFSPLNQINEQTVGKLGLAWSREMGTTRGLEATPLVENGVLYTTGSWSTVEAIDAKTGDVRWSYDPKVPRDRAYFICCDIVNRGVALYRGKVYVATLDGRLIALDEKTGMPVWSVATTDPDKPYSITSAPRIARDLVVIGNAAGEYGARGYITAYDAETGKQAWRTYTVPGDPSKGFESKAMESAAKTWSGEYWKTGGAAIRGKASPMTPRSTFCISARPTPLPGIARSAAAATASTPHPSWPFTPATANSRGISRPRPAITLTTMPPNLSCKPTSPSAAACAK